MGNKGGKTTPIPQGRAWKESYHPVGGRGRGQHKKSQSPPASVATRFMTETQTFWPSLPSRCIIIK
jgi:hypothetical protein